METYIEACINQLQHWSELVYNCILVPLYQREPLVFQTRDFSQLSASYTALFDSEIRAFATKFRDLPVVEVEGVPSDPSRQNSQLLAAFSSMETTFFNIVSSVFEYILLPTQPEQRMHKIYLLAFAFSDSHVEFAKISFGSLCPTVDVPNNSMILPRSEETLVQQLHHVSSTSPSMQEDASLLSPMLQLDVANLLEELNNTDVSMDPVITTMDSAPIAIPQLPLGNLIFNLESPRSLSSDSARSLSSTCSVHQSSAEPSPRASPTHKHRKSPTNKLAAVCKQEVTFVSDPLCQATMPVTVKTQCADSCGGYPLKTALLSATAKQHGAELKYLYSTKRRTRHMPYDQMTSTFKVVKSEPEAAWFDKPIQKIRRKVKKESIGCK